MEIIKKAILIAITGFCFTGCYPTQQSSSSSYMHTFEVELRDKAYSFKGYPVQALIQLWGPPTEISTDGGTGKIYTYIQSMQFSYGLYNGYNHFYVNNEGIIYHVLYKYTLT